MTRGTATLFQVNDELLAAHPDVYGPDPPTRCVALAEALTCSPAWAELRSSAHIVVRPERGVIGILGHVPPEHSATVSALGWQVEDLLRRLRPVTYRESEAACLELAAQLRQELTSEQLLNARLIGIPRGGLIVAGMLAYALQVSAKPGAPGSHSVTILVDDCALSGVRLREALDAQVGEGVVVAVLHAHPDLCRQVEADEPVVQKCLAARLLSDHAPEQPDPGEWAQRWAERSPRAYWIGNPDHVCYPWNEPDAMVWNPVTERAEGGWRVVPPSWSVKNRVVSQVGDLQRCRWQNREMQVADGVVWAATPEGVVLAALGTSNGSFLLRETAAAMWQALASTPGVGDATEAVSTHYRVEVRRVHGDFQAFISRLTGQGLLHPQQ